MVWLLRNGFKPENEEARRHLTIAFHPHKETTIGKSLHVPARVDFSKSLTIDQLSSHHE